MRRSQDCLIKMNARVRAIGIKAQTIKDLLRTVDSRPDLI